MDDPLEAFIEQILFERGGDDLDTEVRAQMKKDLLERAERRVNAALVAALPPERLEEFEKVVDTGAAGDIQAFCQKYVPDMQGIIGKELIEFKALYQSA